MPLTTWSGGVTGNFPNLLQAMTNEGPQKVTEAAVRIFLESDGLTRRNVLEVLPRDDTKAQHLARPAENADEPDKKRYRDPRLLVRTIGLAYDKEHEGEEVVRVTALGHALMRWSHDGLDSSNVRVIARYAARSLSAVQLRHPGREGRQYSQEIEVFPFAFIWRAMLALDGFITLDELNRGIYRTKNERELLEVIERIKVARLDGDIEGIGLPAIERGEGGALTDRRVKVWMSWASLGWTFFSRTTGPDRTFRIATPWAWEVLENAAATRRRHRVFDSVEDYVEHLSHCAGLPPDVRI